MTLTTELTSMLDKWDYSGISQMCYSDENCESYKKAAEFLDGVCEDWGGGTGWAKQYFKVYKNIDGSPHKNVDVLADLVKYTSKTENILMRQVLECNPEWKTILDNVKKSFSKKFCLIIYTPLDTETKTIDEFIMVDSSGITMDGVTISEISFKREDILAYFPEKEYKVSEETIKTNQGYGTEWILYVQKLA